MGLNNEETKPDLPVSDDPREFLTDFFESDLYQNTKTELLSKMHPSPGIASSETEAVINNSDEVKAAFFDYAQRVVSFQYNSKKFPRDSARAISEYLQTVRDEKKVRREYTPNVLENQRKVQSLDTIRYTTHLATARQLHKDKIVPSERLSKAMATLVLIEEGLQTYENARRKDVDRVMKRLGFGY
ncbi:MAG: hypothetical protein Q8Q15_00565 [bacterium]|nr:hypothetical protein [bacterium]